MNSDQIKSLVRSILLGLGASLVATGKVSDGDLQSIVGGLLALGSLLWSQFHHSEPKP